MSQAVFLHAAGDARVAPFNLREGAAGETLLDVAAVGLCGSDLHFFSGMQDGRFPAKNLPAVFGHEDASTVVAADPATGSPS